MLHDIFCDKRGDSDPGAPVTGEQFTRQQAIAQVEHRQTGRIAEARLAFDAAQGGGT